MDGKLVGRLSPGIHLTCRLSVTPRDGPAPVFVDKTEALCYSEGRACSGVCG